MQHREDPKFLINEFLKFIVAELKLKTLPRIKFATDGFASHYLTFGHYHPDTDTVTVVLGGRHIADVLRTLAHELVHHKQREEGRVLDGSDESEIETEANAKAGVLMRRFRMVHPEMFEIFNVGPWGFHTNMEGKIKSIINVAKTGKAQKIDEQYIDGYTAKLLVTVMHKLSPENRKKFCNESISKMVATAYQLVTR
jgi:hypothetical protein